MFDINNSINSFIKGKARFYSFKCANNNCNNVVSIKKSDFKYRKTGLCKKCSNLIKLDYSRKNFVSSKLKPYEALYNSIIKLCKEKQINISITFEEFLEFTKINNCVYCNSEVTWVKYNISKNGYRYNLDRKDSTIGYKKDNLVVCCWRCNDLKSNKFSFEEFKLIGDVLKIIDANRKL